MDEPPLLEARGVSYRVDASHLIDGLDCSIARGRRTMVLGANGAGKSLTLRLLHGLLPPTSGEVLWNGQKMGPADRLAQAMVFQRPVHLRRSVRANLEFALNARGRKRGGGRVSDALEAAGLAAMAGRAARSLSGGEMQRLAIARALIVSPEVIFFDEPTANLDPTSTAEIEAQIMEASAAGISVVMVTHSPGQARRLAQDVVFLHRGQVVEAGPAQTVLHHPKSEAARQWLEGGLYL